MITKNIKKITGLCTVENIKDGFEAVNLLALKTTEDVVLNGFKKIEKYQKTTEKAIRNGLKFTAKKQDVIFDSLETSKVKLVKNLDKSTSFFSKN